MIVRNAVRVFPEPVGDETRTFFRSWMRGTAYAWGSVRPENFDANQSRTSGWRSARTSSRPYCLVTLRIILCPFGKTRSIAAGAKRGFVVERRIGPKPPQNLKGAHINVCMLST